MRLPTSILRTAAAALVLGCSARAETDSSTAKDGASIVPGDSTADAVQALPLPAADSLQHEAAPQQPPDEQPSLSEKQSEPAAYPQGNPFMAVAEAGEDSAPVDSPSSPFLLIDISRGVTLSDLFTDPANLDVTVRPGFVWDLGARFALNDWLLAGVAVRYFEATYSIHDSYTGIDNEVSTETRESLRFVSLPIELTAILNLKHILPYISIAVEPALFASGFYFAEERVATTFADRSTLVTERSYDQDISDDRERYHAFAGGGIGIEIPYGFASVFVQGLCLVGVRDIGSDNTRPIRTASRLLYIPISLGLRFSL